MADAEKIEFDLNALTFGDLCDIEDAIGESATQSLIGGKPTMKAMAAAVWVTKRRSDPAFTFEQARELPITVVDF